MNIGLNRKAQSNPPGEQRLPSLEARLACRAGMANTTAGIANGFVQGNLAILPEKQAGDFHRFCQLNPKPCPIIGMSDVGDPKIPALGLDLDIRTDLPRYRVWRDGEVVEEPTDIAAHWRDDLVAFVLGCSYSFEDALMAEACRFVTSSARCACRCTVPTSPALRPGRLQVPWWCRCARSSQRTPFAPCRSPRVFLPFTGRRFTSVIRT